MKSLRNKVVNPAQEALREEHGRSRIRVLFYDHTAAQSGAEIAMLNLVRGLDRAQVEPIVVFGGDGPVATNMRAFAETHILALPSGITRAKKESLGIKTVCEIRSMLGGAAYIKRLAQFISRNDIDLVHTNSLKADVIGGFAARLARRPLIWHVRDRIADDYLPPAVVRLFRVLSRHIPDFVIANSRATLRTTGVYGEEHTAIIHDGTPWPFPAARTLPRDGHFRIGLVGRISPWKGQHIFLKAAGRVHKKFPHLRFFVIGGALFGETEYEQEIRALTESLGISEVVTFTGFRSDVQAVIADMDLIVHASVTGEPFGQVIIEGMAAGKPIIATNGGGVPEIVEDGKTGILIPMGDPQAMAEAISRLAADPVMAETMGARGWERVRDNFTMEHKARKVESLYRAMLSGHGEDRARPLVALPSGS